MTYSEMVIEDGWEPMPQPLRTVSCALPDLQCVIWTALGAVVIVAALAVWGLRKLRPW